MAIDTAAKRKSAFIDVWGVLPLPDGTIDSSDRLTLIGQYSGIAASAPVTPTVPTSPSTLPREFRWYRNGKRIYFPDFWIDTIDFELLERGGFGQATVHALATWEEMALTGEERLDVYLWGVLMFRGFVRIAHKAIGTQQEARPTLYGHMERCNGYQTHCRYAYGSPVDLSVVFQDIVSDHVQVANRLPNITTDIQTTGVTIDRFDGSGKNVTQAFNALCDLAPNQVVWGFDVDSSNNDRIYIRPRSTNVVRRYSLGGNAVSFDYPLDLSQIVNRAILTGGKVSQPNLVTDGSFENPLPNSETNGNLLGDYSFEAGTGGATLSGGATRKGPGDHGGSRTGSYWAELDTPGETATWTVNVDSGIPLVASFWARRETNSIPSGVRMHVQGLDAGSGVVVGFYVPSSGAYTDPGTDTYVRYLNDGIDFSPYPTVTQARVAVECNSGTASDDGTDVDDVALYEKGASPAAWTYSLHGNAKRAQLAWQTKSVVGGDPFHGCYAVLAQASGISVGTDYMEIKTSTDSRVQVRINNPYSFGIFYRTTNATTAFPAFQLLMREYKSDGTLNHETLSSAVTVATATWQFVAMQIQTASDTATLEVGVRLENGEVTYFDGAFLCYGSLPAELTFAGDAAGYWEGDTYERTADVTNTALTGLDATALTSITDYGEHEDAVSIDSVVDWDTAKVYLADYFNAHATPEIRGTLRVIPESSIDLLEPTGTVKLLNLPSAPSALYAGRVRYTISDGVEIDADIGNSKPEMADLLRTVEERAKRGL